MRIIHAQSPAALAQLAADWVAEQLAAVPHATLALPTGQSPLGLYAELVRRVSAGSVCLTGARLFNLDEYLGVAPADEHSYAAFLARHLVGPLALAPGHVRFLRGDAPDPTAECRAYDAAIAECGGIDSCVLGLGANGHIAFNEPGTAWDLRTHVVELSSTTRAAQNVPSGPQGSAPWTVPQHGITMGIKTLLEARRVLLLIAGAQKRAARDALYRGVADVAWPVTALAQHPDVTIIELS